MKRGWLIAVVIVLALALIGLVVRAKFFSQPGPGALRVASAPKAVVFLDGSQVGETPYFSDEIAAGEHLIKLVPLASEEELVSWEGKVKVISNILTFINRDLAGDEASSAGEVLSLEKIGKRDVADLAVVSIPDKAVVRVNGEPKGFAPKLIEDLNPGDYQVTVSSPGFEERNISASTIAGYKLTVSAKLAQKIEGIEEGTKEEKEEEEEEEEEEVEKEEEEEEEATSPTPTPEGSPKPTPTPPEEPYVKIKETSTGWLRVREEPNTNAEELAKVYPGEMYVYLEEEESGWYKIEYEDGEEGWVSGVYVDLFE